MFGHAVADLRSRDFRPLCVYAYTPNRRAIRFYQQAGFTLDGTSRLDQRDGIGVAEVRLVAGQGDAVARGLGSALRQAPTFGENRQRARRRL